MDIEDLIKPDGDRIVTNIDVDPPSGWTNDFEAVGGHGWLETGDIANIIEAVGIESKAKPLFGYESGGGEVAFQAGDNFYLYNPDSQDVLRITNYSDLESLVSALNDSGLNALRIGPPGGY